MANLSPISTPVLTPEQEQAEFDTMMLAAGRAKPSVPRCHKCDAPEWTGRKLFARRMVNRHGETETLLTCGDCLKKGIPLTEQPVREPEPINWHAWQTPCDEGVGGL